MTRPESPPSGEWADAEWQPGWEWRAGEPPGDPVWIRTYRLHLPGACCCSPCHHTDWAIAEVDE